MSLDPSFTLNGLLINCKRCRCQRSASVRQSSIFRKSLKWISVEFHHQNPGNSGGEREFTAGLPLHAFSFDLHASAPGRPHSVSWRREGQTRSISLGLRRAQCRQWTLLFRREQRKQILCCAPNSHKHNIHIALVFLADLVMWPAAALLYKSPSRSQFTAFRLSLFTTLCWIVQRTCWKRPSRRCR